MSKYKFMYPAEMIGEILNGLKNKKKIEFDFTNDTEDEWNDTDNVYPTGWYGVKVNEEFNGLALICGYYGGGIDFAINIDEYDGYEEEIKAEFCDHLYSLDDFALCVDKKICVERMDKDSYDKEL